MNRLRDRLLDAAARVVDSGQFILGPEVHAFESEFAQAVGVPHCVGVASGTDAVALALAGCGVGAGDGVITPSHTAVATVSAIESVGAVPVFADVADDFTLDPDSVRGAVESRAGVRRAAIVAVHLYGLPADMAPLRTVADEHGLVLVEDGAQAHGASYNGVSLGALGDAAAFSFYPTKNLGAIGDAGAVTTSTAAVDERVRDLRQYGWRERYISQFPGRNSRLDEMQAAMLRVLLPELAGGNEHRRVIARQYSEALGEVLAVPSEPPGREHVFHQYVVRTPARDDLRRHLAANGIGTAILYPVPVHLQPAYASRCEQPVSLARTERLCKEILSLPIGPHVSPAMAGAVVNACRSSSAG